MQTDERPTDNPETDEQARPSLSDFARTLLGAAMPEPGDPERDNILMSRAYHVATVNRETLEKCDADAEANGVPLTAFVQIQSVDDAPGLAGSLASALAAASGMGQYRIVYRWGAGRL